jgi:hypothetical protein
VAEKLANMVHIGGKSPLETVSIGVVGQKLKWFVFANQGSYHAMRAFAIEVV